MTYEANNDATSGAVPNFAQATEGSAKSAARPTLPGDQAESGTGASEENATGASLQQDTATAAAHTLEGGRETGWATETLADPHLSGTDPRMFPGILTRGQRSGSFRTLGQAEDGGVAASRDTVGGGEG